MSKIIKANHLIFLQDKQNSQEMTSNNYFTLENAEILYQETKLVAEELIADAKNKAHKILSEANIEAGNILAEAQKKAEKIVGDSQLEVENIKKRTYSEAFKEGKEAGLAEVAEFVNEANELVKLAYKEKEQIIAHAETEIINLAVKIAEKVIRQQINLNEMMQLMVKNLLGLVQDAKEVVIKLNADDYTYLNKYLQELQALVSYGELRLEVDNSLKNGDCLIISETGILIAKIDSQLEKIRNALMEVNSNA